MTGLPTNKQTHLKSKENFELSFAQLLYRLLQLRNLLLARHCRAFSALAGAVR